MPRRLRGLREAIAQFYASEFDAPIYPARVMGPIQRVVAGLRGHGRCGHGSPDADLSYPAKSNFILAGAAASS